MNQIAAAVFKERRLSLRAELDLDRTDLAMRNMMTLGCTAVVAAGLLSGAAWADVPEIRVLMSGAFTAAFTELSPVFERSTGSKIVTTYGGSMGSSPDTIPNRLRRGEPADVVIMAAPALDELIKQGTVIANNRVDLARSTIGLAVRAGAP